MKEEKKRKSTGNQEIQNGKNYVLPSIATLFFSIKINNQITDILVYEGSRVSVTTTELYHCSAKADTGNM